MEGRFVIEALTPGALTAANAAAGADVCAIAEAQAEAEAEDWLWRWPRSVSENRDVFI